MGRETAQPPKASALGCSGALFVFEIRPRFSVDPTRQTRRDREAPEYCNGRKRCGERVVPK